MRDKLQGIIFDMDGLMVDTEPLSRLAWDRVLAAHGHELEDDFYRRLIGLRIDETTGILLQRYDIPLQPEELMHQKSTMFAEIRAEGVEAMPGLFELHDAIQARGLAWAVATSSPRQHAEYILDHLGLDASCSCIAGGDEVARGKPAPDIYLLAAERLGLDPNRCLAMEDSAPGCRAAHQAGMMVVAIPSADTAHSDFAVADFRFESLHEVAAQIDSLLAALSQHTTAGHQVPE